MAELFDSRYFAGQGKVFVAARSATGTPDGLLFLGDLGEVKLTPSVERSEMVENVSGGHAIGVSFLKKVSYNLSMTMRSIKAAHLAQLLQGTATAQAAGSVVDEAHTVRLGKFSRMSKVGISTVVVTGTGGTPTYVANTDYKVHAEGGMIEWLSGGTVTEGLAVLIDFAYVAQNWVNTNPNNTPLYLVFDGINQADNKRVRCEIYRVKLDPGALDLITADPAEATVGGAVELDTLRAGGDQLFRWIVAD